MVSEPGPSHGPGARRWLAAALGGFERLLEAIVLALMLALAFVVTLGIGFRSAGRALVWYDEVASILLAWLTYYGAALAALKRAHIGVPGIVEDLPPGWRFAAFATAEALVLGFFALVAWVGMEVLVVIAGDRLVSLPWVPAGLAQSVIPVGAASFILAQLLSAPAAWRKMAARPVAAGASDGATE
ncbi:MAG: TRAP transporter small permease [Pseudomonadota bacterium]